MIFNFIGQLVVGWLLADFLSGLFHWWQDRWPSSSARLIGSYLIVPSRVHHRLPIVFTKNSFMYRNTATVVGVMTVALVLLSVFGLSIFLMSLTIGGLISTQVHYLAHCPARANRFGRFLQASGIIQSPKHHAKHHRPPHGERYCILTDFTNPFLDELKLWERLERLLTRLGVKLSLGEN